MTPSSSAGQSDGEVKWNARSYEVITRRLEDGSFIILIRDLTEINTLREELERNRRLAAVGTLAAGIAHEIRNPLGSIALFASLLMKEQRNERDLERLSQIIAAVRGMDNKISNLMLFARKQVPMMRVTGLHGVLKEVIGFSGEIVRQKGVSIEAKYVKGNPGLWGMRRC